MFQRYLPPYENLCLTLLLSFTMIFARYKQIQSEAHLHIY